MVTFLTISHSKPCSIHNLPWQWACWFEFLMLKPFCYIKECSVLQKTLISICICISLHQAFIYYYIYFDNEH